MNWDRVTRIADAVLYEGYILYPYRASSVKNQKRFNFGVLVPPAYSEAQSNTEACAMRTECLVEGDAPRIEVRARFLQLSLREIGRSLDPASASAGAGGPDFEPVVSLDVDGVVYHAWQEAVERDVVLAEIPLSACQIAPQQREFTFGPSEQFEPIYDADSRAVGLIVRRQQQVQGAIAVEAALLEAGVWKVRVDLRNTTTLGAAHTESRDHVLFYSFASAHTMLGVDGGRFVSLLEPGELRAPAAALCQNVATWPVLVGAADDRDMILSSPIILYDYPQIALESGFDFCDGTEIDEMLALRVLTLTDEEKRLMQNLDLRTNEILKHTESLSPEHWMKLHGAIRGLKPVSTTWS